jgi:ADP-ribose pyrophosphatase
MVFGTAVVWAERRTKSECHVRPEATASASVSTTAAARASRVNYGELNKNDKATGAKAGWQLVESRTSYENKTCRLREDRVELKNGDSTDYAYLERADAVIVVPVTENGDIVLVKQYRYPVDEWCLEVPAGGTHDTGSKSLEEVARKELREEIGATCAKLTYVTCFYSAPAFSDEKCHVFVADGVKLENQPQREASESIETRAVPVSEALELARRGELKSAPCALAVLLCEGLLGAGA